METFTSIISGIFSLTWFKALLALALVGLVEVAGADTLAYQVLFVMVTIDFITGFSCGVKCKTLSSRRASRTLYKLILYILLVVAAHQLTRYATYLMWVEHFLVVYLGITEMLSIIENAHKLGVPIPEWVTEKLEGYLRRELQ